MRNSLLPSFLSTLHLTTLDTKATETCTSSSTFAHPSSTILLSTFTISATTCFQPLLNTARFAFLASFYVNTESMREVWRSTSALLVPLDPSQHHRTWNLVLFLLLENPYCRKSSTVDFHAPVLMPALNLISFTIIVEISRKGCRGPPMLLKLTAHAPLASILTSRAV